MLFWALPLRTLSSSLPLPLAAAVDAAALSVARALVHAAAAADQIAARAVAKARADAAAADDAGSLISQGYTDSNTYFAADYVGTSRTFT